MTGRPTHAAGKRVIRTGCGFEPGPPASGPAHSILPCGWDYATASLRPAFSASPNGMISVLSIAEPVANSRFSFALAKLLNLLSLKAVSVSVYLVFCVWVLTLAEPNPQRLAVPICQYAPAQQGPQRSTFLEKFLPEPF